MRRDLVLVLLLIGIFPATAAEPKLSPPPLAAEAFFEPARLTNLKISPNGRTIGALKRYDDQFYALVVFEPDTGAARSLTPNKDQGPVNFWWKTDDLLLVQFYNGAYRSLDLKANKFIELDHRGVTGLTFQRDLPDDEECMLFSDSVFKKINLRTGGSDVVEHIPDAVRSWFLRRNGEAVAGWGRDEKDWLLLWRAGAKERWQKSVVATGGLAAFVPLALATDERRLVVEDFSTAPTGELALYDPTNGAKELLVKATDLEPSRLLSWGRDLGLGGVIYETDHVRIRFLNQEAADVYGSLEGAFRDLDYYCTSFSNENRRIIVTSHSDRDPGTYTLLDRQAAKLTPLGAFSAALRPADMAPTRFISFAAGDGMKITGRITLPVNATRPPVVVLLDRALAGHRAHFAFDPIAQFLASRGYAVLRVDHRGTSGFGREFSAAGDFQLERIADDIASGLKEVAAQGWCDERRAAVLGHGRDGLIALKVAALSPRFKALVNIETPLDLSAMKLESLTFSGRDNDTLLAGIGGTKNADAFRQSLDPMENLAKLNLPTLHYYPHGWSATQADQLSNFGKIEAWTKKHPGTSTLFRSKYESVRPSNDLPRTPPWKVDVEVFEAVALFLSKSL